MKNLLVKSFLFLIISVFAYSCSDDDNNVENQEHLIQIEVTCSNPNAHFRIWNNQEDGTYFQNKYESKYITKDYRVGLSVECKEDPKALLTVKIYQNKKLVQDRHGNEYVKVLHTIKGHPL